MPFTLPEECKIVSLTSPITTNAEVTSDAVSLKNAHKAWIVVNLKQAATHATLLTLMQATDVAVGTNAVLATAVPIWYNDDTTTDALTRATDAINYTTSASVADKMYVFEIDPATLTAGYDVVYLISAASSEATNIISTVVYLQSRYPGDQPPAAITD